MLPWQILWTDDIEAHIAEHGLSPGDFEWVYDHAIRVGKSKSSGLPCKWGYTEDDRYVIIVFEELDDGTVLPVTAFEVPEP